MGLDDLTEGAEESAKKDRVVELAEKLGVEDVEDLEKLDDRLADHSALIAGLDSELEKMVERVSEIQQRLRRLESEVLGVDSRWGVGEEQDQTGGDWGE